ncbi:DNA repair protein RecN [Govanella unica]|uniref:DNA repair protein RecN n=1 Tax=Govanella unica TaxID=2975056 RepID=A0A9X3U0N2_9PROT|nr:DNA repair protein RecN [Govania unica]MDA5195087.1 DNA repair protein RecN [Govania unica]
MLKTLSIRDIVVIERLDLSFEDGLCVLTGETGAGKSILLDSLGLALGARAERGLVRPGAERGQVTALFELAATHAVWGLLRDQGLDEGAGDGILILRRMIEADGRTRAFLNDAPIGVGLMREIGDQLVEIHGQHDDRGLLNAGGHRRLLDAFIGADDALAALRRAHGDWDAARGLVSAEQQLLQAIRADEDYLRHSLAELDKLDPVIGEEEVLSARRTLMMQGEKLRGGLGEVLNDLVSDGGADGLLRGAMRRLERMPGTGGEALDGVLTALERASIEAGEAIAQLEEMLARFAFDPREQDATEERLFALRGAARKHHCAVDDLQDLRDQYAARLSALDHSENRLRDLVAAEAKSRQNFEKAALALRQKREKTALSLDRVVNAELAPLKLDKAKFRTRIELLPEEHWTADGGERIEFEVATNPGAPFGPLMKIASGGEQSRFILALKVVLAARGSAPTLIFDEVDRGVGGAVADAVGERLAQLAGSLQVLVVTHSPQVAAAGSHHWHISKRTRKAGRGEEMITEVQALDPSARQEEIARMLAGARITDEARAAAAQLMQR